MSHYSPTFFAQLRRYSGLSIQNATGQIRKSIVAFPILLCCFFSVSHITAEAQSGGFERGLAFYNKGQYDEALNEFNAAVNKNSHSSLSYYYAAHIRLKKKQYSRSEKNLLAALRDSTDFSDATGLLAFTHLRMGKTDKALEDWRIFTEAVGILDVDKPLTADSIMLPEDYRSQLALQIQRKKELAEEERKKAAEEARADSISAAMAVKSPEKPVDIPAADSIAVSGIDSEAGTTEPAKSLDKRVNNNIRDGVYGLVAVVVCLIGGITTVVLLIRKKMRSKADYTFNAEIKRVLEEKAQIDDQFERDENRAIREYEAISREISGVKGFHEERKPESDIPAITTNLAFTEKMEKPERHYEPIAVRPQKITEEVKALVTRMFREGHAVNEIARAADLTQTEVELIIAVRARRMEQLIQDVTSEEEDYIDSDQLYKAINELHSEGHSDREIARKLEISTSEVKMALSIINLRNDRRSR